MSASASPAVLVLESGRVFRGVAFGARTDAFGEAVFNTSMTGYQEILTDPSYAGQIVVMTAPHIGNTGVNDDDLQAARPACAGFAVREASPRVSSWRARGDLGNYLADHGVPGIEGVDTRALTRALRDGGAQRAGLTTDARWLADPERFAARVREIPSMEGRDLASGVTGSVTSWDRPRWRAPDHTPDHRTAQATGQATGQRTAPDVHVVCYDFGVKRDILAALREAGCRVTVVPAHTPARDALALGPDGFLLSNGPGDPAAVPGAADAARALVDSGALVFGICLGHQILALALGARTFKLPFGHHGGNHPVLDVAAGTVAITAHNHGFAVDPDSLPDGVRCTHISLYDRTLEGFAVEGRPVRGVQYHPEAGPGPRDADALLAGFVADARARRGFRPGAGHEVGDA